MDNTVAIGEPARLLIRLLGGAEHEATAVPSGAGVVEVKLLVIGGAADPKPREE